MLRITQANLSASKTELDAVNVNTSGLGVCHDPIGVFGDEGVGAVVYRVQQLISVAATSLGEVTDSQSKSLQTIDDSMGEADRKLASDAS